MAITDTGQDPEALIEITFQDVDDEFWIIIRANRKPYAQLGPFSTPTERQLAYDDLLANALELGAKLLPNRMQ